MTLDRWNKGAVMAEERFGGILGAEDEDKPEVEGPDPLIGTEAFAAAVAARLSGNDPGVARETEEFLRRQSQVLKIQAEHLADEHTLRLTHMRSQLGDDGVRWFSLLAGAISKLSDANRRGPHWADPLKQWGDILLRQGQRKDALVKYNEALKYAPHWAELKQAAADAQRKS